MKINFVLPFYTKVPGGGTKIMYEYANRLALLGNDIVIYHLVDAPYFHYSLPKLFRKIINLVIYQNKPIVDWFKFHDTVKLKFADNLNDESIRDADATITTWWSLAEPLQKLNKSKGKKINLIQDYEVWEGNEELVLKSYSIHNVQKIGISPFIIEKVKLVDRQIFYIPNSINEKHFNSFTEFYKRKKESFLMLYSNEQRKASDIGIKAFVVLKKKFPNINLTLFGTYQKPKNLPDWINYKQNPDNLPELYNQNRYFVTNSISEGWGLPSHEAMACGNLLICTAIEGHKQFYDNFDGVLTYKAGSVDSLVEVAEKLLSIPENIQMELSEKNEKINQIYSWDNAVQKLISIIENE